MRAKDYLGRAGEERAASYLEGAGFRLLARNWRCTLGEIDIVASQRSVLAVVEVKTRRSELFGHPFEALTDAKRRRLWRLASHWAHVYPHTVRGRTLTVQAIALTGPDPRNALLEHLEDVR